MTNREERDQRVLELEALAGDGGRPGAATTTLPSDPEPGFGPEPAPPSRLATPPAAPTQAGPSPAAPSPRPGWVALLLAVLVAAVAGAITYVIANGVSATYKASTQVQVTVDGSGGLGQDSVLAGNQLTAQLAQLTPTDAVLTRPAVALGTTTSKLRDAVSVGTVSQQNILEISATASSRSVAELRASAVTAGLLAYMRATAQSQLHTYRSSVGEAIAAMNRQLARLAGSRGRLTPAQLGVIQGEAGAIAGQAQALSAQTAERAATSVPTLQVIQPAASASQVAPKPLLYAIVALLVVGFVALQLATLSRRHPTAR